MLSLLTDGPPALRLPLRLPLRLFLLGCCGVSGGLLRGLDGRQIVVLLVVLFGRLSSFVFCRRGCRAGCRPVLLSVVASCLWLCRVVLCLGRGAGILAAPLWPLVPSLVVFPPPNCHGDNRGGIGRLFALRGVVIGITPTGVIEIAGRLSSFFLGRIVRHADGALRLPLRVRQIVVGVAGDTRGAGLWACWSHSVFTGVFWLLAGCLLCACWFASRGRRGRVLPAVTSLPLEVIWSFGHFAGQVPCFFLFSVFGGLVMVKILGLLAMFGLVLPIRLLLSCSGAFCGLLGAFGLLGGVLVAFGLLFPSWGLLVLIG